MKIGLLIIATNKYIDFVQPLINSINLYFLKNHNVKIFCFTDDKTKVFQDNVVKIYQEHLNWPYITLKRYEEELDKIREQFKKKKDDESIV